jgi:hypothetical protein
VVWGLHLFELCAEQEAVTDPLIQLYTYLKRGSDILSIHAHENNEIILFKQLTQEEV